MLERLFQHPVQLAILGSGDPALENRIEQAAGQYPGRLGARIGYDEGLAHRIEAGSDCFLMPSRFEPCGLNQLYSLCYGTVPIVKRTGGLADSVTDLNDLSARDYTATGLVFDDDTPEAVLDACLRALRLYRSAKVDWWKLVITGMQQNYCWLNSAAQYFELYRQICPTASNVATPAQRPPGVVTRLDNRRLVSGQ
jgi:starch synthase